MALELSFGTPQLVLSWPVADQLVDQLHGFLLQLLGTDAVSRTGIAEAERIAADQVHRGGAGALGVLGTTDQLLVQPRRLTMAQDAECQVERVEMVRSTRR